MKVGIQLPEVERTVPWEEVRAIAMAAEESGFDSIWVGDHLLYRRDDPPERGPWDAWTQLAALAAVTSRVRLGPLVAATAFHSPGHIARMAAGVAEISGGRFVLGLGAGWNEPEFRAFGFPFDHLGTRFEESFEIVRRLLTGERVTFKGRYHHVDDAVLLPRPARPVPVMVGSSGPRVLAAALPHADAWNVWYDLYGNSPREFAVRNREVDVICEQVGRAPRDVDRSACVLVAFGKGGERPHNAPPVQPADLARHLKELEEAGAQEAILVVDPINERSVREIAGRLR